MTNTEEVLRQLTSWLEVPWEPDMLRHHEVGDRLSTSHMETTTDQVTRPLYREALSNWVGNISLDLLEELYNNDLKFAAALRHFGYSPRV